MRTPAVIRYYSMKNPAVDDIIWLRADVRDGRAFGRDWLFVQQEAERCRRNGAAPWLRTANAVIGALEHRYIKRMHLFEKTPWRNYYPSALSGPDPMCYRLRDVECCLDLEFAD